MECKTIWYRTSIQKNCMIIVRGHAASYCHQEWITTTSTFVRIWSHRFIIFWNKWEWARESLNRPSPRWLSQTNISRYLGHTCKRVLRCIGVAATYPWIIRRTRINRSRTLPRPSTMKMKWSTWIKTIPSIIRYRMEKRVYRPMENCPFLWLSSKWISSWDQTRNWPSMSVQYWRHPIIPTRRKVQLNHLEMFKAVHNMLWVSTCSNTKKIRCLLCNIKKNFLNNNY